MSRHIDVSNPESLSDEDRAYLRARGRVDVVQELDRQAAVAGAAAVPEANARIASAPTRPLRDVPAPENKKQISPPPVVEAQVHEEELPPYSEWTVEDLREELRARELPVSGNKDELVDRLEENDRREGASS